MNLRVQGCVATWRWEVVGWVKHLVLQLLGDDDNDLMSPNRAVPWDVRPGRVKPLLRRHVQHVCLSAHHRAVSARAVSGSDGWG
jgi:hypothetical protein